jgi:hypothetical protein
MEQLAATKRIELEIEVRKAAINVAHAFGLAGIEFFCQQFPDIAKEYVKRWKKKMTSLISFL